jgi:hypothetical protein
MFRLGMVLVPPVKVLFLFILVHLAKIPVRVSVGFSRPLIVIDLFVGTPDVIVRIAWVVNAIPDPGMYGAARNRYRQKQSSRQKNLAKVAIYQRHLFLLLLTGN